MGRLTLVIFLSLLGMSEGGRSADGAGVTNSKAQLVANNAAAPSLAVEKEKAAADQAEAERNAARAAAEKAAADKTIAKIAADQAEGEETVPSEG